jgi:GH3 auxin-responsive promoter
VNAIFANSAWFAGCIPEYLRFRRALSRVREEQERVLLQTLRKNQLSEFGRLHRFSSIRTVAEYRQRVPLREYDDYCPYVDRIAHGAPQVLTEERVRLFEPTSGSASAAKWIPYTASLQNELQRGIRAWVASMFLRDPGLLNGPAYWAVSPVLTSQQITPSGIPIGFADDCEYVGGMQKRFVRSVMAVPPNIRGTVDMDSFWYATLLHLVRRPDLRFISVWNPSFLTLLMDRLSEFADRLAVEAPKTKAALNTTPAAERHAMLWPHLRTISCWTDGNSAPASRKLAALFPQARVQNKGLIATEGFISLPWESRDAPALAVRSHFFEFLPVDSNGHADQNYPRLANELDVGQHYSVILTTGGGLYRYLLGDIIEVVGRERQCPLVRFLGRNRVADWCGEKLHETQVTRVLTKVFSDAGVEPSFSLLACDTGCPVPSYTLYIETSASDGQLSEVAAAVEKGLAENFHYRYARQLGQLGSVRVLAARHAEASYMSACVARGQRAGCVKAIALDTRDGWTSRFDGRFVETGAAAGRLR